jgi:formate dehydrogenase subunit delta
VQTTVRAEIRLANDIAAQFHHMPTEQAADAIAGHIRGFWEPRMRAQLFARVTEGADGLDPLVVAAVALLR